MAETDEVSKPPPPQYPEMILAAIEALGEKNGSSKTAIAKYIESQYGELPAGHETLLAHHLGKMKEGGELVMAKNNYMRPDPDAPPRRGRGRPPKPKVPLPPGTLPTPKRPRGRPPKPKDPNAPPKPAAVPRPRGRPPKKARSAGAAAAGASPRPRGRPPKAKPPFPVVGFD